MSFIVEFLLAALTALVLENIIFARALGSSWMLYLLRHPKELFDYTALLTAVTTLSALLAYPLRAFVAVGYEYILGPILYLVCMSIVYGLIYFILRRYAPPLFEKLSGKLAFACFNCAVFGGLLIPFGESMSLMRTVGYGLGMSLGFAGAVLLIGAGLQRLELCHVPKVFRGLPILLIYVGLLSLALYGLIGHQLPT